MFRHWLLSASIPEIDSVEDVKKAAEAAFYYPKGDRGICPSVRAAHYNPKTFVGYTAWNNNEIMLVPLIENPSAMADLENIFAHPDVHMAVFAAGDYGFSVGEGMDMLNIAQAVHVPQASAVRAGGFSSAQRVPEHAAGNRSGARIDALLTYDARERLRRIRDPTLLIAAGDDLLVPWQLSELIAEEIAHARLVRLDRGGHHFPQTQVEVYNTLLLELFRAHSERDAPGARLGKSAVLNPTEPA